MALESSCIPTLPHPDQSSNGSHGPCQVMPCWEGLTAASPAPSPLPGQELAVQGNVTRHRGQQSAQRMNRGVGREISDLLLVWVSLWSFTSLARVRQRKARSATYRFMGNQESIKYLKAKHGGCRDGSVARSMGHSSRYWDSIPGTHMVICNCQLTPAPSSWTGQGPLRSGCGITQEKSW